MKKPLSPAWIRAALVGSALVYSASLVFLSISWRDLDRSYAFPILPNLRDGSRRSTEPMADDVEALLYPPREWRRGEFECLRWIATDDDGEPTGESRECWQRVRGGEAGVCEVRNKTSGQRFHAMRTTSLSLKDEARFTCRYAQPFSTFRHSMKSYTHDPPMTITSSRHQHRGIVMAVYDGVLATAYASIRQLRDVGCTLPIELWTRHDEVASEDPIIQSLMSEYGPTRLRLIHDRRISGFYVKAHAVYYSSFTNVLLLDADNFALRDPTPLFYSAAFRRHGAIFWPDFWHPGNTIFNVHAQSLLWELLGMDYVDMLEQESGQVLIDRARSRAALDRLMFLATHQPNILRKLLLVWGDKDLFRLAWLSVGKSFHFNDRRLPGSIGVVNEDRERFCGLSMAQYDVDGERLLFVHRNTVKLSGEPTPGEVPPQRIWHTLQEYALRANPPPTIQSFNGAKLFNETSCFGVKRFQNPAQAHVVKMQLADSLAELVGLEDKLQGYAGEAWRLAHDGREEA
jgi:alpha 1,2-mannosyltransferase